MSGVTLVDRAWRLAYRSAYPVARLWWRVRQRPHRGALAALSLGDTVLLVRSSYRAEWSPPGGGVEAGETSRDAASRELREEVGFIATLENEPVVIEGRWDGRPETVHVYAVALAASPTLRLDQREVIGTRFVGRADLASLRLSGPARAYFQRIGWLPAGNEHA